MTMTANRNSFGLDSPIFHAALILLVIGLVMVYSASSFKARELYHDSKHFLENHALRVALGLFLMLLAARIDYRVWLRLAPVLVILSVGLLVYLLVSPAVPVIRGSRRWLAIAGFQFQVSDLARLALVLFLSASLVRPRHSLETLKGFVFHLAVVAGVIVPIFLEPDVGTALLIGFVALLLIFVSGCRLRYLAALLGTALPAFGVWLLLGDTYHTTRFRSFLDSLLGKGVEWQTKQSLVALGNGHIWGLGLGAGKQKFHFLPDPFTDFIYAIIGEEFGLIGTLVIVFVFLYLVRKGLQAAMNAPDTSGKLLGIGIVLNIAIYAFVNAAVVANLLPTTGIPMPFISYGGSAMLTNLFALGILLNIAQQAEKKSKLYPAKPYAYRRGRVKG